MLITAFPYCEGNPINDDHNTCREEPHPDDCDIAEKDLCFDMINVCASLTAAAHAVWWNHVGRRQDAVCTNQIKVESDH